MHDCKWSIGFHETEKTFSPDLHIEEDRNESDFPTDRNFFCSMHTDVQKSTISLNLRNCDANKWNNIFFCLNKRINYFVCYFCEKSFEKANEFC